MMTFHESYGEVSKKQLAAYRKHNVSQSDHDTLEAYLGDDHEAIVDAVRSNSPTGSFSEYLFFQTVGL